MVSPMSKMDFMPAQTVATLILDIMNKSADMSKVVVAPRCTPPIPPVTKTEIPAISAKAILEATVVPPEPFVAISTPRSLYPAFATPDSRPRNSISSSVNPTLSLPWITAVAAGTTPIDRAIAWTSLDRSTL